MGVIVARTDAADEAMLEALGFNAFARDLAEVVHEMAAADADEAVLDALGFNAFARELVETVQEMAAADADDEAALDALGALARELAESVLQDTEAADTEGLDNTFPLELAEVFIQEIEVAEAEEAALETIGFNAFALELRDIRSRDEEAFLDELDYLEISRAIDRALEEQREEASSAAGGAAMPRHVACS
jgi:hypothetical protein